MRRGFSLFINEPELAKKERPQALFFRVRLDQLTGQFELALVTLTEILTNAPPVPEKTLTVKLGEYPTMIQYGYAESPGRFDHWGAGHVHTFPNEQEKVYTELIGERSVLTGASLQNAFDETHERTQHWVAASAASGPVRCEA